MRRMDYIQPGIDNRFAAFKGIHPATLHSIFMHFVTPDLLSKIIDHMSDDHFILNRQRNYVNLLSFAEICISLAIVIRIRGLHIVPQEFEGPAPRKASPWYRHHDKLVSLELFTAQ
jgi:hypothetical protein